MKALAILVGLAGVAEAGSHCHEESPIVGRQRCGSFGGRWAHQPLFGLFGYEAGIVFDRIPIAMIDETGNVYDARGPAQYHATTPASTHMVLMGGRQRFGWRGEHTLSVTEVTIGWALDAPTLTTTIQNESPTISHRGLIFDAAWVNGLHTRVGPLELGAELAFGLRDVTLAATLPDQYTECPVGALHKGCAYSIESTSLLLEPRARVDYWVDPQITIAVTAGFDLVHHGEMLAVSFAYHAMLFDGQ